MVHFGTSHEAARALEEQHRPHADALIAAQERELAVARHRKALSKLRDERQEKVSAWLCAPAVR
jgi:hypothetical protein